MPSLLSVRFVLEKRMTNSCEYAKQLVAMVLNLCFSKSSKRNILATETEEMDTTKGYANTKNANNLLTQVRNHINGGVISQYDYVNDAAGRRTAITCSGSMMSETRTDYYYGYNDRNELTNAVKNVMLNEYAYQYDDIGNRLSSLDLGEGRQYESNR